MDSGVDDMKKENILKKILGSRRLKYGTSAMVIMLTSVVLFIVLNLIVSLAPWQWDMTPEGLYSIGDQTTGLLTAIDEEVTIYGLFDDTKVASSSEFIAVMDLLKKYDQYDNITVEYVDPNKNIGFITELDPDQILNIGLWDFVVVSDDSKKIIKYFDMFVSVGSETSGFATVDIGSKVETAFTSAIYYVTRDSRPVIYLTTGHGEYDFDNGYITLGEVVETNGFGHEIIDLSFAPEIPDEAAILMIANPTSDFSEEEIEKLVSYMDKGKSLIIALDSSDSPEKYENLQSFLRDYNLAYGYDKIKEGDAEYHIVGNRYMIFPALYSKTLLNNPIKDAFTNMLADNVRSVDLLRKSNSALQMEPLLISSEKALAESMDENGTDVSGAKFIGVAVWDHMDDSRIIALGTADFVQDQRLYKYKQYEESAVRFMLNSLKWLEGDTDEVFIETKNYFTNFINVTAKQANTVSIMVIYVMPGVILLIGLAVYLRRRNL